jgi:hypothetical protein
MSKASDLSSFNTDGVSFKNRLINGGMVIDQRNAGASFTPTSTGSREYALDRWCTRQSQASKFSIQQSSTAPTGFINSTLITSLSAYSITSSDQFTFLQLVEGFNISDWAWGTASATNVTLSFWVRSSLTGTFGGSLRNNAADRSYPFSYTISVANTFEKKTITIDGETNGTWLTTNSNGLSVAFGLGVGSTLSGTAGAWAAANYASATGAVSVVGTNGATFYITGVQLEKGSSATSFDYRPITTELQLCQRYCQVYKGSDTVTPASNAYTRIGYGPCQSASAGIVQVRPLVTFRITPSTTTSGSFAAYDGVTIATLSNQPTIDIATTPYSVILQWTGGSGLTTTRAYELIINNSQTTYLWLTAEL